MWIKKTQTAIVHPQPTGDDGKRPRETSKNTEALKGRLPELDLRGKIPTRHPQGRTAAGGNRSDAPGPEWHRVEGHQCPRRGGLRA